MPVEPVIVVGSGAAGLERGTGGGGRRCGGDALERDVLLGGTTAISGGIVWAPANRWQLAAGIRDTPDAALRYLEALATGDVDHELMAVFVADAGRVVDEIERRTPLSWVVLPAWPDYHSELPCGLDGGRSIWAAAAHAGTGAGRSDPASARRHRRCRAGERRRRPARDGARACPRGRAARRRPRTRGVM